MRAAKLGRTLAALAAAAALSGCAATVQRVDPGARLDLSGSWNDTDSQLAAAALALDLGKWLDGYHLRHRRSAVVAIGEVRSLTPDRAAVEPLVADLQRALLDARRVTFVASGEERAGVRSERKDQDFHAAGATRKPMGEELGADFLLTGTISAIVDRGDRSEVRYYQVDLALVDVANSAKVWLGQQKIKKSVARPPISDGAQEWHLERPRQRFASQSAGDPTGWASRIRPVQCSMPNPPLSCN